MRLSTLLLSIPLCLVACGKVAKRDDVTPKKLLPVQEGAETPDLSSPAQYNIATVPTDQVEAVRRVLTEAGIDCGFHGSRAYAITVKEREIEQAVKVLRNKYHGKIRYWDPPQRLEEE